MTNEFIATMSITSMDPQTIISELQQRGAYDIRFLRVGGIIVGNFDGDELTPLNGIMGVSNIERPKRYSNSFVAPGTPLRGNNLAK